MNREAEHKKRKREEAEPAEPAKPTQVAHQKQQPKQTPKGKGPGRPAVAIGIQIAAGSPPLDTFGGLIRACYVIDNMAQLHRQSIAPELADTWFSWRSCRYSIAQLLHRKLASFLDVRVVEPELLQYRPVHFYKFLSEHGWHFKPYSTVFAAN
jgi:hypothetical protein